MDFNSARTIAKEQGMQITRSEWIEASKESWHNSKTKILCGTSVRTFDPNDCTMLSPALRAKSGWCVVRKPQ